MIAAPVRRRGAWATLLLAVLIVVGVYLVPRPETEPFQVGVASLPDSYSSVRAGELLARLPSTKAQPAVVVVSRTDGAALTTGDRAALETRLPALRAMAVGGTVTPPHLSGDGTVALVAVPLPADDEDTAAQVRALRAALASGLPEGVRAQVTGAPAFTADLSAVFDGTDTTLLLTTVTVVAVLLLVTYRSVVLWVVPLVVVAVTEQLALRVIDHVLPRLSLTPDGATYGIASVLVFGAATDYALLLIARYRDELRRTEDRFAAMRTAVGRTGEAILASGGTVVVALLALVLAQVEGSRSLGVACAIGIVLAVLAALFVLPAALVLCGRGVFWPAVPRLGSAARVGRVWGRLSAVVGRRPVAVVLVGVTLLAGLAAGVAGLRVGLSQSEQFRVEPEAVRGAQTLARAFPAGATQPVDVLTTPATADRVAQAATTVPGVAGATVTERTDSVARVSVVLTAEPGTAGSDRSIRELRRAVATVPGARAAVGGQVVATMDTLDAYKRDTALLLPIILVLVGLVLVALLRGLLAPVLLVVTVALSFLASLGASWLLFQHVLHYPALDSGVVLISFVLLVALGVDYNIFLVTRAREEARRLGTREGMLRALRVTGGVITSAGILLAAVFAVLGVIPVVTAAQVGIVVGIGVLLDTLLVRTILVPALAIILGDRFWWPRRGTDERQGDNRPDAGQQPAPDGGARGQADAVAGT
ncbi:MMPL family transporter [Micromonospora sp. NPDC048935]|uniref:MMPL family transporter n=1 Tax=Micromonospora sp. NPDC048935 TaxID=3364262 RepID=UPI003716F98F